MNAEQEKVLVASGLRKLRISVKIGDRVYYVNDHVLPGVGDDAILNKIGAGFRPAMLTWKQTKRGE